MDWLSDDYLTKIYSKVGNIRLSRSTGVNTLPFDFEDLFTRLLENLQKDIRRIDCNLKTKTKKSNEEASKLRSLGSNYSSSSKCDAHDQALEFYTKSIAFAEPNSVEQSLSYAERSSVLLKLNRPQECLDDIKRALPNYPDQSKSKLYLSMAECHAKLAMECKINAKACLQALSTEDPAKTVLDTLLKDCPLEIDNLIDDECLLPEIASPSERYPCASDAVGVHYSTEFGRHLVATRDVDVGEVLIVERPYFRSLDRNNSYTHCSCCMTSLWSGIACGECVNAVYCSEECRSRAWKQYHRMECTVSDLVMQYDQECDIESVQSDCLRLLIQMHREAGGLPGLRARVTDMLGHRLDVLRIEVRDEWYQGATLESILCLMSHEDQVKKSEWKRAVFIPLRIMFFLLTCTDFFGVKFNREETFDKDIISYMIKDLNCLFVGRLIIKLFYIIYHNSYNSDELTEDGMKDRGSVTAGLTSLLNHSCFPNVYLQCKRNHLVVHPLFPLKEGEQIFLCYYKSCNEEGKFERQQHLQENFFFKCECTACSDDWPLELDEKNKHFVNIEKIWDDCQISDVFLSDLSRRVLYHGHYAERVELLSNLHTVIRAIYEQFGADSGEMRMIVEVLKNMYQLTGNVKKTSKPLTIK